MVEGAALYGVLVTFRRPRDLGETLRRLADQTRRLDTLVVIDNDADPRAREVVSATVRVAGRVDYVPAPQNLGPAGGLALGLLHVLRTADDADWVMFFDDDNPPRTAEGVSEIVQFAEEVVRRDPDMGGVGLVGSIFDVKSGRTTRVSDADLSGAIPVAYIGGGQLPCYRAAAMREVGPPNAKLFFGFDDLDYGLRLQAAGKNLYINGDLLARERRIYGLMGTDKSPSRRITALGWRDYYSTRNLIWILLQQHRRIAAVRVIVRRIVAKSAYNLLRSPRVTLAYLCLGFRAVCDAYLGRMGRTIDPIKWRETT